jgi:hypothetical protein
MACLLMAATLLLPGCAINMKIPVKDPVPSTAQCAALSTLHRLRCSSAMPVLENKAQISDSRSDAAQS